MKKRVPVGVSDRILSTRQGTAVRIFCDVAELCITDEPVPDDLLEKGHPVTWNKRNFCGTLYLVCLGELWLQEHYMYTLLVTEASYRKPLYVVHAATGSPQATIFQYFNMNCYYTKLAYY